MAWQHRVGDGQEEALVHEQNESCWIPLAPIRGPRDVSQRLVEIGQKNWITKADLIELAERLLSHVEHIQKRKEEQAREQASALDHLHRQVVAAVAVGGARAVAEVVARDGARVQLGTRWGEWEYRDDTRSGLSVCHGHYCIDLGRAQTPEDVGQWVGHLLDKAWASPRVLGDLTSALAVCSAERE